MKHTNIIYNYNHLKEKRVNYKCIIILQNLKHQQEYLQTIESSKFKDIKELQEANKQLIDKYNNLEKIFETNQANYSKLILNNNDLLKDKQFKENTIKDLQTGYNQMYSQYQNDKNKLENEIKTINDKYENKKQELMNIQEQYTAYYNESKELNENINNYNKELKQQNEYLKQDHKNLSEDYYKNIEDINNLNYQLEELKQKDIQSQELVNKFDELKKLISNIPLFKNSFVLVENSYNKMKNSKFINQQDVTNFQDNVEYLRTSLQNEKYFLNSIIQTPIKNIKQEQQEEEKTIEKQKKEKKKDKKETKVSKIR